MGDIGALALMGLFLAVLVAAVFARSRGRHAANRRAGMAVMEADALFSPARRHQIEQQRVVELSLDDPAQSGAGPDLLDLDSNGVRLRPRRS